MQNEKNVEKFELVELEDRLEFFSCSSGGDGGGDGPGDGSTCPSPDVNDDCEMY